MELPRENIVFVINSLTVGGAERVLVELLRSLEAQLRQYDVHLVLLDAEAEHQEAPLWVKKHTLNAGASTVRSTISLACLLRRLRPSVTFSFLTRANCASILACRFLGLNIIISERVHTSSH